MVNATCFDLTSHLQAYPRTIKLITIRLCTFGIPDGSQCVLGFANDVIPMYFCIYATCVLLLGAVVLVVMVMSVVVLPSPPVYT